MIGVNRIHDILELVVWSGYFKDELRARVLITAPVEAGKTELVLKFSQTVWVKARNVMTILLFIMLAAIVVYTILLCLASSLFFHPANYILYLRVG